MPSSGASPSCTPRPPTNSAPDQAPVRLAGLYALERLAHSTAEHRQTIVDVICAYLRMPYTPPQPSPSALGRSYRSPGPARRRRARTLTDRPPHTTPTSRESRQEQAQQEQQVRLTAQNILVRNLRIRAQRRRWWHRTPPPAAPVWPGIRLDLAGALLLNNFFLEGCQLDSADFGRARFTDTARFRKAEFIDTTYFGDAEFTDLAIFSGAQFTDWADFADTKFADEAYFEGTQFATDAIFTGAEFAGRADFCGARFTDALFVDTKFADKAYFLNVQFADKAYFLNVQFADKASFKGAQFTGGADFEGTRVASAAEPGSVWPPGWTTRPARPDNGEDPAFLYLTKVTDGNPPDT